MMILLSKPRRGFLRPLCRLRFVRFFTILVIKALDIKALLGTRVKSTVRRLRVANMYVLGQSRANLFRMHECSISKCIPCASKVACTSASDK